MTTATSTSTADATRVRFTRANGRCPTCKAVKSIRVIQARKSKGPDRFGNPTFAWRSQPVTGDLWRGLSDFSAWTVDCNCGASMQVASVKGVLNPEHACSAKCVNATGHKCECSCGGANHGAAHG